MPWFQTRGAFDWFFWGVWLWRIWKSILSIDLVPFVMTVRAAQTRITSSQNNPKQISLEPPKAERHFIHVISALRNRKDYFFTSLTHLPASRNSIIIMFHYNSVFFMCKHCWTGASHMWFFFFFFFESYIWSDWVLFPHSCQIKDLFSPLV